MNQGAWYQIQHHLQSVIASTKKTLAYAGRARSPVHVWRPPCLPAVAASFAPDPGALRVSRVPGATGDPTLSSGIWRVNLASGEAVQLSVDGSLPGWLP